MLQRIFRTEAGYRTKSRHRSSPASSGQLNDERFEHFVEIVVNITAAIRRKQQKRYVLDETLGSGNVENYCRKQLYEGDRDSAARNRTRVRKMQKRRK